MYNKPRNILRKIKPSKLNMTIFSSTFRHIVLKYLTISNKDNKNFRKPLKMNEVPFLIIFCLLYRNEL